MDRIIGNIGIKEVFNRFIEKTFLVFVAIFVVSFTTLYLKFDIFWSTSLGVAFLLSISIAGLGYKNDTFRCVMYISIVSEHLKPSGTV